MKADILIKNGIVIDAGQGLKEIRSLAVVNGKIIEAENMDSATFVVDATGCFVVPGLIDFHTHIFYGGSDFGLRPDRMLAQGTTAAVDAGSSGCANVDMFYRGVVLQSEIKIKNFLSVCSTGLCSRTIHQNYNPNAFDVEGIRKAKQRYGGNLLGLKIAYGEETIGSLGMKPLEATVELAENIGDMRVCVHPTGAPCTAGDILERLRPGDIFCHCYHGKHGNILDQGGMVKKEIREARERGIVFDAANGISHCSHDVMQRALSEGFLPDIISSDAVSFGYGSSDKNKNLLFVMSKYLNAGMDVETIIKAVTETPAALMGMENEIGTLKPGACADIAILEIRHTKVEFRDYMGALFEGNQLFVPRMTICNGQVAYCQTDFNNY